MPRGSLVKKSKPIFKDLVIATAGDLGKKGWADSDIARYMKEWGGRFSPELDESVTHLMATKEQFKKNVPRIKEAKGRKGKEKVDIVSLDWLEDSMIKGRKLPVAEYSLKKLQNKERSKKKQSVRRAKGIRQAVRGVNPNMFHVYRDSTFFQYEITLSRGTEGERYIITLWESNAQPHLYQTVTKYYEKKGSRDPAHLKPNDAPGPLERELAQFRYLFRRKTGLEWDERMEGKFVGGHKFVYQPPSGGKPVGLVKKKKYDDTSSSSPISKGSTSDQQGPTSPKREGDTIDAPGAETAVQLADSTPEASETAFDQAIQDILQEYVDRVPQGSNSSVPAGEEEEESPATTMDVAMQDAAPVATATTDADSDDEEQTMEALLKSARKNADLVY